MLTTNFALRPLIREDEDKSEAWEVLRILNDDSQTVYTQRVGIVNVPIMGYTPLTLLQFVLSCFRDQNPEEQQNETGIEEGEFTEV